MVPEHYKIYFPGFCYNYVGYTNVTDEVFTALKAYDHMLLIEDVAMRKKIVSYFNAKNISFGHKLGRLYYYTENPNPIQNMAAYRKRLDADHIFRRDKRLADATLQLFSAGVSPLLADEADLVGLPPAYLLSAEMDPVKDEGLLYAERLRQAGVRIHVEHYMFVSHSVVQEIKKSAKSREMQSHLINYIQLNV